MTTQTKISEEIEARIRALDPVTQKQVGAKTLKALDNIISACNKLDEVKGPITITSVAALTSSMNGGPTSGSIRNRPITFVAYIRARAAEQRFSPKWGNEGKTVQKTGNADYDVQIAALDAENRMLKSQIASYTALLKKGQPYDLDALIRDGDLVPRAQNAAQVSLAAREAIAALRDEKRLLGVGLKIDKDGNIVSARHPKVFLFREEMEAIQQTVGPGDRSLVAPA